MIPAPIGLTFASYFELPNLTSVSVKHHTVRFLVLLVVVVGALGFSKLGTVEAAPATDIHRVA
jgi:hypothetical protein